MVATTEVHVFNGVPAGTPTDITSTEIRFKRADDNTVDANNPVPVPAAGTNYSWRKHTKLSVETTPDNKIENLRFFSSGSALGTGITHFVGTTGTYTQGSGADESSNVTGGSDSTTYTAGSPLTITAGTVVDVLDTPSFPTYASSSGAQDFAAQQIGVDSTAGPGNSGIRTMTYRYDES